MRFREARGKHLHAADVRLARAILRVDRERQRFDRREVQVGHFLHVALLVFDAAQIDLVAAIGQVQRRRRQQRDPVVGRAADDDRDARGRDGADEIARRAPEKILVPDLHAGSGASRTRSPWRRAPCCRGSTRRPRRAVASPSPRAASTRDRRCRRARETPRRPPAR